MRLADHRADLGGAVREYLPNGALAALALGVRCNEAQECSSDRVLHAVEIGFRAVQPGTPPVYETCTSPRL